MSWYVVLDSTGCRLNIDGICGAIGVPCSEEHCPKRLHKPEPDVETYLELTFFTNRKDKSKNQWWVKDYQTPEELGIELKRFIKQVQDERNIPDSKPSKKNGMSAWAENITSKSPTTGYAYEIIEIKRKRLKEELVEFK